MLHTGTGQRRTTTRSLLSAEKMEEICYDPNATSAQKVRSFIYAPAEKSAVLTVATLLARNVYHIGGTLAVPQKCRLIQIGKSVCVSRHCKSVCLREGNPIKLTNIKFVFFPH